MRSCEYCGRREALSLGSKDTQSLVRSHLITRGPTGLVTIGGGKWTTYRRMAEESVDYLLENFAGLLEASGNAALAASGEEQETHSPLPHSSIPLIGAKGWRLGLGAALRERRTRIAFVDVRAAEESLERVVGVLEGDLYSSSNSLLNSSTSLDTRDSCFPWSALWPQSDKAQTQWFTEEIEHFRRGLDAFAVRDNNKLWLNQEDYKAREGVNNAVRRVETSGGGV
ncbi:hypothetical protein C8J56DRAFT_899211 [Mycena floridula]|nr:hypothetical protein C8J56DRAFT_899211 [Mycena floridula]